MSASGNSPTRKTDFTIEHILTRAGNNYSEDSQFLRTEHEEFMAFSWLHCTRYCPPKLPRAQKREGPQKRQLGRHPRIPFSSHQLTVLEEKFKQSPYLSSAEVTQLSRSLQLADVRVKIWFQNRRARERRERNDQESQQLKPTQSNIDQDNKQSFNQSKTTNSQQIINFPLVYHETNFSTNTLSILPAEEVKNIHCTNYKSIKNLSSFT